MIEDNSGWIILLKFIEELLLIDCSKLSFSSTVLSQMLWTCWAILIQNFQPFKVLKILINLSNWNSVPENQNIFSGWWNYWSHHGGIEILKLAAFLRKQDFSVVFMEKKLKKVLNKNRKKCSVRRSFFSESNFLSRAMFLFD